MSFYSGGKRRKMAPTPEIHEYEVTYTYSDFGIPHVVVDLWEQPVTEKDRGAYFILAPEAEVLIYDREATKAIYRKDPDIAGDLWAHARRWGDIQELLKEEDSSLPLAELKKRRFKVAITREVWEVPYPRMLSGIIASIREKNHRRNLQIEELNKKLGITR